MSRFKVVCEHLDDRPPGERNKSGARQLTTGLESETLRGALWAAWSWIADLPDSDLHKLLAVRVEGPDADDVRQEIEARERPEPDVEPVAPQAQRQEDEHDE